MSEFFKQFLREDVRKLADSGERALFLGTFGKHPGWDDHIEENSAAPDLGLRTESLVLTKALLYVQGVGRNIDSNGWEKLEPAQQLPAFNHLFLWRANDQFILGRIWSSRDGKGRTRYPMVLAAHVLGVPLHWALGGIFPRLERLREECCAATTAVQVAARLNQAREDMRSCLPDYGRSVPLATELMTRFVHHPQFGTGHEGLLRILYQLQDQAAAFAPGHFNPRADNSALRPQDLRIPAAGAEPEVIFTAWSRLLHGQVDPAVPVLFLWPAGEEWMDILIGEPAYEQFFCLRATTVKLPCVSEIPFNMDPAFRARAQTRIEALVRGDAGHGEPPRPGGSVVTRLFGSFFKGR